MQSRLATTRICLLLTQLQIRKQPYTQMKHILQDLIPTLACIIIHNMPIYIQAKVEIKSCRMCFICVCMQLLSCCCVSSKLIHAVANVDCMVSGSYLICYLASYLFPYFFQQQSIPPSFFKFKFFIKFQFVYFLQYTQYNICDTISKRANSSRVSTILKV